jgi:hypothetical protein
LVSLTAKLKQWWNQASNSTMSILPAPQSNIDKYLKSGRLADIGNATTNAGAAPIDLSKPELQEKFDELMRYAEEAKLKMSKERSTAYDAFAFGRMAGAAEATRATLKYSPITKAALKSYQDMSNQQTRVPTVPELLHNISGLLSTIKLMRQS